MVKSEECLVVDEVVPFEPLEQVVDDEEPVGHIDAMLHPSCGGEPQIWEGPQHGTFAHWDKCAALTLGRVHGEAQSLSVGLHPDPVVAASLKLFLSRVTLVPL